METHPPPKPDIRVPIEDTTRAPRPAHPQFVGNSNIRLRSKHCIMTRGFWFSRADRNFRGLEREERDP